MQTKVTFTPKELLAFISPFYCQNSGVSASTGENNLILFTYNENNIVEKIECVFESNPIPEPIPFMDL